MADKSIKNPLLLVCLIVSFFILHALFMSWSFQFLLIDDAYISFQYGKHFISGNGLVFNKGEYVEGYTNFLWTVLTSPLTLVESIDISYFVICLGILLTCLCLYVLYRVTDSLKKVLMPLHPGDAAPYFVFLPSLFFAFDSSVAFWSVTGLETPLFVLFLLLAVYYYFDLGRNNRNVYLFLVFSMLCTLTRPEGNLLFAVFFLNLFINRKQLNDGWSKLLTIAAAYIVFALIYYSFKYFYYGSILPNTFHAKGSTNLELNLPVGFWYVSHGLKIRIAAFILMLLALKFIRDYRVSFLYIFFVLYLAYVVYVGGDWPGGNRFLLPVLPALYLLAAFGLVNVVGFLRKYKPLKRVSESYFTYGIGVALAVFLLISVMLKKEYSYLITPGAIAHEKQQAYLGKWLKEDAERHYVVATGLVGRMSYYSELKVIDMLGLCNREIAMMESSSMVFVHEKYNMKYIVSLKPDYLIGGFLGFDPAEIPPDYELVTGLKDEGFYIPVYKIKKKL